MIIDCHLHLPESGLTLDPDVVEMTKKLHIDKLCISHLGTWDYEPKPEVFIQANTELASVMKQYPDLVLGLCYVNPAYPEEAMAEFKRGIEELGMVGLKLWTGLYANDPRVFPLVEQAIEYGVPILQHTWHKVEGNLPHESDPIHVAELAHRYPAADFIMAHIGGDWERGVEAIKDYPNVSVDTSGSIMDLGMIEYAVQELGGNRVLYGSDSDGADMPGTLGKILDAEISETDRVKILGGNMQALLERRKSQ